MGLYSFRRMLYVGVERVAGGCTSFAIHDEFLVLTTEDHTCRFLALDSEPKGQSLGSTFFSDRTQYCCS